MIENPANPDASPVARATRSEAKGRAAAATAPVAATPTPGQRVRRSVAGLVAAAAIIVVASLPAQPAVSPPADAVPLVVALDFLVPVYQGGAERFRTPATIDTALAEDLGKRLGRPVTLVGSGAVIDGGDEAGTADMGTDVRIAPLDGRALPPAVDVIPLDYRTAPMAIMRTDSPIQNWKQLRGRKVCVAIGGQHVGDLQRQYGAIEIVHPSPTDALIAVRIGECDAMVHDSAMLERLIRLPEWAKFSKALPPPQPSTALALLASRGQPELTQRLQDIVADWKAAAFADGLTASAVRNIAFEVYLQQEVPDCH